MDLKTGIGVGETTKPKDMAPFTSRHTLPRRAASNGAKPRRLALFLKEFKLLPGIAYFAHFRPCTRKSARSCSSSAAVHGVVLGGAMGRCLRRGGHPPHGCVSRRYRFRTTSSVQLLLNSRASLRHFPPCRATKVRITTSVFAVWWSQLFRRCATTVSVATIVS